MTAASMLLLMGCPDPIPEPACGDLRTYDLSDCEVGTLGQVYLGGIYNAKVEWESGATTHSSIYTVVSGAEKIDGHPVQSKDTGTDTYYLGTKWTESGSERRLSFAGCQGLSHFHFTGHVQSCVDGVKVDEGTFDARWIDWGDGEGQQEHLALVSETKLASGSAADVWVQGGFAYVAARAGGLAVFDVSVPSAPVQVATVQEAGDDWSDAKAVGSTLYVASAKHGVLLYDIANPAAPVRLGQVPAGDISVRALELDRTSNRLFASSPEPNGEVLVFNIQTPAAPVLRWRIRTAEADVGAGRWPHAVALLAGRMFVNQGTQGLVSFDVPPEPPGLAEPVQRGTFGSALAGVVSHSSQAAGAAGRTVVFEGGQGWGGKLRAVDFSDPVAPAQLAEWLGLRPELPMRHLELVGTKLYVAHHQAGLRIIDVSDPSAPAQVGYFNTWRPFDVGRGQSYFDSAMGVRVPGDGNIYVAESARGLMIFGETAP
ncbi:MAG TPA: hypothetical protein VIG99_12890 [Myxococcaceae bacterium]